LDSCPHSNSRRLGVGKCARGTTKLGAERPTLLVTDRHGTVYWREVVAGSRPNIDEALSWLAYINILEPECGTCVPAWPVA
jgi:hypothetical protein